MSRREGRPTTHASGRAFLLSNDSGETATAWTRHFRFGVQSVQGQLVLGDREVLLEEVEMFLPCEMGRSGNRGGEAKASVLMMLEQEANRTR
jgi:hypothetical protein